ncbi:MAG TPA: class I SAM-dependent methyltransferase [Candidatus Cybelea sp.]|nr:class I SAM-dependent methyltransferase [Candidatus Cybelea sp.]
MMHDREPAFAELLAGIEQQGAALKAIGGAPPPQPRWNQDWFPRLDAAATYTLVRREKPGLIVEVGSGHSTRFLARAVADGKLATRIVAIDPAPRAVIAGLAVTFVAAPSHEADPAIFAGLRRGDMLFVDSSHILMPGSDVDHLLGRVIPVLPSGVLLHVHDIFLPDDYPAAWDWRGYNEQQGLLGLLQGGAWRIEFASRYVTTRMAPLLKGSVLAELPLMDNAFETSLWLRKI